MFIKALDINTFMLHSCCSTSGNRQNEIENWDELIADLAKIQPQMLDKKQNFREIQFPPL